MISFGDVEWKYIFSLLFQIEFTYISNLPIKREEVREFIDFKRDLKPVYCQVLKKIRLEEDDWGKGG